MRAQNKAVVMPLPTVDGDDFELPSSKRTQRDDDVVVPVGGANKPAGVAPSALDIDDAIVAAAYPRITLDDIDDDGGGGARARRPVASTSSRPPPRALWARRTSDRGPIRARRSRRRRRGTREAPG